MFEGSDDNDGFVVNDENRSADLIALADTDGDLAADGSNADPLNIDSDFREALDTDGDNVRDEQDIDDDKDGILDTAEGLSQESIRVPSPENAYVFSIDLSGTTDVTEFNPITGETNVVGTLNFLYNAVAINEDDGYFWGIDTDTFELVVVDPSSGPAFTLSLIHI